MADPLNIGISGLRAFQRAMATTSHNVANVNTEGYSRQRVDMVTRTPQFIGGSSVGSGVQPDAVRRVYDQFLTEQVRSVSSSQQNHEALYELAGQIDSMLADPEAGMMPALQGFFEAVHDVANDPTSSPARQVLLSNADSLEARFQNTYDRLDDLRGAVNTRLDTMVDEVSALASSIADVNQSILYAPRGSDNAGPNDLLDQRDRLITQLSEYISVRTQAQDDGTVNVFVGNGQPLVVGTTAQGLDTVRDPYDPTQLRVAFQSGSTTVDITGQLSGGRLGGTLEFRDEVLNPALNGLGRVAIGLAETFNAQHRLGQDLDGDLGSDFFSIRDPEIIAHSSNAGSATLNATVSDVSQLTTSDYRLERSGADYSLTRLSDGAVFDLDASGFPGSAVTVDGVELSVSAGTIADGDSFEIRPTRKGADGISVSLVNTNDIAAAAPIRTGANASNTGLAEIGPGSVSSVSGLPLGSNINLTYNASANEFNVTGAVTTTLSYDPATDSGTQLTLPSVGISFEFSGTPADGDQFTIANNTGGVGDNRNALELAALQSKSTLDNQTTSVTDAYGGLVANVGARTRQAQDSNAAQSALLEQSVAARESVSGVNLDEEAANLLRFQQAYQASAQVIGVAGQLFQSLLAAIRS